jgi:ferredoxin-thioredoxin reductase catalytic subunit
MKLHLVEDKETIRTIREALKKNDWYCPCVYQSKGKPEYKCICKDFIENVQVGETCHCGLYVKDEL